MGGNLSSAEIPKFSKPVSYRPNLLAPPSLSFIVNEAANELRDCLFQSWKVEVRGSLCAGLFWASAPMNMYIYGHNRCITSITMHNMNTNYMILSYIHSRVMYNLQTEEKISTKFLVSNTTVMTKSSTGKTNGSLAFNRALSTVK